MPKIKHPEVYVDGKLVKDFLKRNCLLEKDFAKRYGISESYLSELIQGKSPVGPNTARKLKAALITEGADPDSLKKLFSIKTP